MVDKIIEYCKIRKVKLEAEANLLFDKDNMYSERDEFAAAIHYVKLCQVNEEWLEMDARQTEAEKELPPEVDEHLFI
jgi:hypothetical protein